MSLINDYVCYAKYNKSYLKPFVKTMFYASIIFRISNLLYKYYLIPLSRICWLINRVVFGIDIDPRATLNKGFIMLHGNGIVIGRYVLAEGSFIIYQGATLGRNSGKSIIYNSHNISQPIIMDNVIIGINAAILGPVILQSGTRVGANAVVTKSFPPNSTIVLNNKILNSL